LGRAGRLGYTLATRASSASAPESSPASLAQMLSSSWVDLGSGSLPLARVEESQTWVTLLGRLGRNADDADAWSDFVEHYGRKIYAWCRVWGLQDADAEDVTQHVLLKLAARLREFQYEPGRSFRAWLKTLTHHAWYDFLKARKRPGRGTGDSVVFDMFANVEAREDLAVRIERAFDLEQLQEAMARVRLRIEPRTWDAFRLLTIEEWSGAQAAQHLGMKVATVFVARSKVARMIREEVARLDRG
jgi:RNA polymerase sigma factor (sigma-70 family)